MSSPYFFVPLLQATGFGFTVRHPTFRLHYGGPIVSHSHLPFLHPIQTIGINFFAWALRGLAVNEFDSGKYDEEVADGVTQGEQILTLFGFTLNGEPFTSEWKWYAFVYTLAIGAVSMVGSTFLLEVSIEHTALALQNEFVVLWLGSAHSFLSLSQKIRFTTGKSLVTDSGSEETDEKGVDVEEVAIPFTKVNLTFKNVHYTVVSSITNENLELLKGIDGYVEAGKVSSCFHACAQPM